MAQNVKAPELRVPHWIDANGEALASLSLSDLGDQFKIIFCFKASCPGCHARGFPAMQAMVKGLEGKDVGFAVIHTAFDDDPSNSQDKVRDMQVKYDLKIPFGHDPKVGANYPTFMQDYRTRGTPFFIVIDPNNNIVFADFNISAEKVIEHLS